MGLRGFANLLRARSGTASLRALEPDARRVEALVAQPEPDLAQVMSSTGRGARLHRLAALCRSASREIGLSPHPEQILAALGLVKGYSLDMATGEGKTLVALLAAGMLAAEGRHVHVLCPNDYLAARDHALAAAVLTPLGIATGCTGATTSTARRAAAYACPVVHSTVQEIAYDLMRDGLALDTSDLVSPQLDLALVDELDSVLLDEATQPLVIARTSDDPAARTREGQLAELMRRLVPGRDFTADPVAGSAAFTDAGTAAVETAMGCENLFAADQLGLMTAANAALHAHAILQRDVDYVVRPTGIALVSATRGRVVDRQRWPEGLQRAVEAKEQVVGASRVRVMDQLTVQEVVRSYRDCLGMSATATLAAEPLHERYGFLVARVPPHRPLVRVDEAPQLYLSADRRDEAVVERAEREQRAGRPVLVGTQSVDHSRRLVAELAAAAVRATVLNATNASEEAEVIARAGDPGIITISTQMAGRGTDIVLTEQARENGGLVVIGAGRHPTARLDAQLRGRAGRQGDPGTSVLMGALDDPLFGIDAGEAEIATDEQGQVLDPDVLDEADHQQRALEARMLAEHEQAWMFTRVPAEQRREVLNSRRAVLMEPISARRELFRHLGPQERNTLSDLLGERLDRVCAQVVLETIDARWSEHLDFLTSLREGIHLRRLARLSPLVEFEREAREHGAGFLEAVAADATARLAEVAASGIAPVAEERTPGALWAYEVIQVGWGSPEDKFLEAVGRQIRSLLRG